MGTSLSWEAEVGGILEVVGDKRSYQVTPLILEFWELAFIRLILCVF
jgi:hypothetical protein